MSNLKPYDLRLGNIVSAGTKEDGSPLWSWVTDIYSECIEWASRPLIDGENMTGIKYVKGIELSPEILMKCGFHEHGQNNWFLDYGADLSFTLIKGILVPEPYYTGQPMCKESYPRYLHQLQNLIYFLTGKELQVNL